MKHNRKFICNASLSDMAVEQLPDVQRTRIHGAFGAVRTDLVLPSGDPVITVHAPRIHDSSDARTNASDMILRALRELADGASHFFFVGLGNAAMTCDSLGALAASRLLPTRLTDAPRKLAVLVPGVAGKTGIDTVETVTALVERLRPDCVLVCDALAARDPSHIGSTFQLSTVGISPASGVGQASVALNRFTLGCPVIAVGVPTVVRAGVLAADMLAAARGSGEGKERMLGKMLDSPTAMMIVCPKEIDVMVARAAEIIADAVNHLIERPLAAVLQSRLKPR